MYGGTQTEMQRLIKDAAALDSSIDANSMSFANIVKAINVVQTEMGITGTTADEAGRTISGSIASMKASWTNLLTGLADGNADISQLVNNLVTSIVGDGTESNLGVLGNIMPAVKTALTGASKLVSELIPAIVQEIPSIISENLPILAEAAISIIQSLVDGISENQDMLVKTIFKTIKYLANSFVKMLPQIVQLGLDLIVSLANGIAESLPELIPTIIDVILQIVETLTDEENLTELLNAAVFLIEKLSEGLIDAIPQLVDAAIQLILRLVEFLLKPENIMKMHQASFQLISALVVGIIKSIPTLLQGVGELAETLLTSLGEFLSPVVDVGKNIVEGIKSGIKSAWNNLKEWFSGLFDDLIGIAKKILGIKSPSRVFKKIGGFTAEGFGLGFEDEFAHVKDDMEDAMNFEDASVGINASIRKVGGCAAGSALGGTSIGNVNIRIDGAKYSDEEALADAIAVRIQNMTDRRSAVYA